MKLLICSIILFEIIIIFSFHITLTLAAPNDMPTWTMPDLQIDIGGLKDKLKTSQPVECGTDEQGNKKFCISWIGQYIAGIYQYAISIVGILSAVVLMFGGIIWLTAGGSATQITNAKAWIGASLTGLVIALCSYMILYLVNPNLTIFNPLGISIVSTKYIAPTTAISNVCKKDQYKVGDAVDFSKVTDITSGMSTNCNKNNLYATLGINNDTQFNSLISASGLGSSKGYKVLVAIAAQETSCQANAQSNKGACGIMQLKPETAKLFDSRADCQWLKNNPAESIRIAAQFIGNNSASHGGDIYKIFTGYNSGYGTDINPTTGKKGGLAPSSDCPGKLAFECCINPGDFSETQDYVFNAARYYNSLYAP